MMTRKYDKANRMGQLLALLVLLLCALQARADVTVWVRADAAPYVYTWNGHENGTFPGMQATESKTSHDGKTWWKFTFAGAESADMIINNGASGDANQTRDITGVTGERWYIYNGHNFYLDVTGMRGARDYFFFQPNAAWRADNATFYSAYDNMGTLEKIGGYKTEYEGVLDVYLFHVVKTAIADGQSVTIQRRIGTTNKATCTINYTHGGFFTNTQTGSLAVDEVWFPADPRPLHNLTRAEAEAFTYTWTDEHGDTQTAKLTDVVTDPYQMVDLLRFVFMTKSIPGTKWRGYHTDFTPEETFLLSYKGSENGSVKTFEKSGKVDYKIPPTLYRIENGTATLKTDLGTHYSYGDYAKNWKYWETCSWYGWQIPDGDYTPDEEGLTMFMMEVTDTYSKSTADNSNKGMPTRAKLVEFFRKNIKAIHWLEPMRVENGSESTTLYSVSGNLSDFYFISKGKCAGGRGSGTNQNFYSAAPFGVAEMFEEYSPVAESGEGGNDYYQHMINGDAFPIIHDCSSILREEHVFLMNKDTHAYYDVSNMLLSIPDYRMRYWSGRHDAQMTTLMSHKNYNLDFQPHTRMFTVTLTATRSAESAGGKFTVTLNWESSLNEAVGSEISQVYTLYRVIDGEVSGEPLFTGTDITTFSYEVEQHQAGYNLTYVVYAQPADGTLSRAQSNNATVNIPGTDPDCEIQLILMESSCTFDRDNLTNTYTNVLEMWDGDDYKVTPEQLAVGTTFYLYRMDDLGSDPVSVSRLIFTSIDTENKEYKYDRYDYGVKTGSGTFGERADGAIAFEGISKTDVFNVSTEDNTHPNKYTYRIEFQPANQSEEVHSNDVEVLVFKTRAEAANPLLTQAEVDADIYRPTRDLEAEAAIDVRLPNNSNIFEIDLFKNAETSKTAWAQRENSGNYMVHDGNGGDGVEVEIPAGTAFVTTTIVDATTTGYGVFNYYPQAVTQHWAPKKSGSDYVRLENHEYDKEVKGYDYYGANRVSVPISSASISIETSSIAYNKEDAFTDDDVKCYFYEVPINVTFDAPPGYVARFMRVWHEILAPGDAHETKDHLDRLDQTERVSVYSESMVAGAGNIGSASQDWEVTGSDLNVYDMFGATAWDVTPFPIKYYVRVYFVKGELPDTPDDGPEAAPRRRAEGDSEWIVAQASTQTTIDNLIITAVNNVYESRAVKAVRYCDLQGRVSDRPMPGVNIVVTTYDDGTTSTRKVVR